MAHADCFINQIHIAHLGGKLFKRHGLRGDIFSANGLDQLRFGIGRGRAGINEGPKAVSNQGHGAENANWSSAEHDGGLARTPALADGSRVFPRQTLLHLPDLRQRLFRHGQRFNQHSYVPQIARHEIQVLFLIDEVLRQEPMGHFDPALGKVAGKTKILPVRLAGRTGTVRARPAHRRDYQVAWLELGRTGAGFDDFAQRFVPQHQKLRALRRCSVVEVANLPVRPANADFDRADFYLTGRLNDRRSLSDHAHRPLARQNADRSHFTVIHLQLWVSKRHRHYFRADSERFFCLTS